MLARSLARAGVFALTGPPNDAAWSRDMAHYPMFAGSAGQWDAAVDGPSVSYDGTTWWGWFAGSDPATEAAMGYMTSADGLTWTRHLSGGLDIPVLGRGHGGIGPSGEDWTIYQPNVYQFGSTFYCYFNDPHASSGLSVATSSDGITWTTIARNFVTFPSGVDQFNSAAVILIGSTYHILIEAHMTGTSDYQTFYFTSSSLTSGWTIGNGGSHLTTTIPAGCPGTSGPFMVQMSDGLIHLYYHAGVSPTSDIYAATINPASLPSSPDAWTISNGGAAILTRSGTGIEVSQLADPCVVLVGSTWYLYCSAVWSQSPFQADLILATAAAT